MERSIRLDVYLLFVPAYAAMSFGALYCKSLWALDRMQRKQEEQGTVCAASQRAAHLVQARQMLIADVSRICGWTRLPCFEIDYHSV